MLGLLCFRGAGHSVWSMSGNEFSTVHGSSVDVCDASKAAHPSAGVAGAAVCTSQPARKIRYHQIDALRGFAVSGIIFANLPAILNIFAAANTSDERLQAITNFFVNNKFYSIFGFLFGVSLALYLGTLKVDGRTKVMQVVRRMVILLGFGFLHSFAYSSDVLRSYAVVGLVVPLAMFIPKPWDRVVPVIGMLLWLVHPPMGFLLLGFWLTYNGYFQRMISDSRKLKMLLGAALAVEIPLAVGLYYVQQLTNPTIAAGSAAGVDGAGNTGSSVLMILASFMAALSVVTLATIYAAAILLATRGRESVLTKILAPYGRMALTNYISQSLLAIAVGHALGVYDSRNWLLALALCSGIIAVQMVFSYFWMRAFRYGPLEWIWRAGTRLELPPMRK